MSSKTEASWFRTVAFRLTAWYVILFAVLSTMVLGASLFALQANLRSRTDEDLEDDVEELETVLSSEGLEGLQAEFNKEQATDGSDSIFLILVAADGAFRASTDVSAWSDIPPSPLAKLEPGEIHYLNLRTPDGESRARAIGKKLSDGSLLCIGESIEDDEELMAFYSLVVAIAFLVLVLSGSAIGWWVAHRAMSGVTQVTQTAVRIGRYGLGERVEVGHPGTEIEDLALAFNGMLSRIAALIAELKEVSDNIAHDLRTPITRLRGTAETTLTSDSSPEDFRDLAAMVVEESDYMISLINTMLEIAANESGLSELRHDPVDINELLENACDLFTPMAEKLGIRLLLAIPSGGLTASGDATRLQRVVSNLLDNAIKHTPSGGTIRLAASGSESEVVLTVADDGWGIAPEDLPRIFDRFYRADASRSQPGTGLGLSLSQSILRAHGGTIVATSEVGNGSTFTVTLPAAR